MERPVVESKIADTLKTEQKGKVLFVDDFIGYGNVESVKKALARLTEKKVLVRIAHGIYLYPKTDGALGILYPSTEEIAQAIAKRDKARIVPTGIEALNKLGLSTQVPMKVVYLTDGAARSVRIGNRTITFKRVGPKNLLVQGEISGLVIQALKSVGQSGVSEEMLNKISQMLRKEKEQFIRHDATLAPAWISKILMQAIS